MEDLFKLWTAYLVLSVEASAGIIIGLAAIEATYKALILFFGRRSSSEDVKEDIRLQFGRWLSLDWNLNWVRIFYAQPSHRPGMRLDS